jgi:hypothetical protein
MPDENSQSLVPTTPHKIVDIATKTPYNLLRSSKYQTISDIETINQRWIAAHADSRRRLFENIKAYVPIDGSSWDEDAYAALKRDGRHPVSIDIASRKIDTLAGSIRAEKWDFDFMPIELQESPLTKAIKYYYYADKEQNNYSQSENRCLVRGLLHSSYEEMEIRYDIRATGSIGFSCPQSGMVLKDPNWQTDDLRDWVRAIKHGYFTAREIIAKWGRVNEEVRQAAERDGQSGETYGNMSNVDMYQGSPSTWGSKHLVIEYRWIEAKKVMRLHGRKPDGKIVEFPANATTREQVQLYMRLKGVTRFQDLFELPYMDRTLKVVVCCPSLTKLTPLFEGDHDVQCGGIGFFPFSACREFGIDKGIMDAMLDVLRTLNYRQSKLDDILASTAAGAKAINVDSLPNGEADMSKLQENITKPNYVFPVHGDPSKIAALLPTNPVPPGLIESMSSMIDLFDRVTPVTPALEGSGESGDSGILFEMKHAVTKLGTLILYENWRQHLMNKAEAWYNQALVTYKDVYRKVPNNDTGGEFEFNKPVYMANTDGSVARGYTNAIGTLPRSRVIIALSKESPTERVAQRAMLYDITKILSANPQLFQPQIRILVNQIFETIEMPPGDKSRIEMMNKMQELRDMLSVGAEIEGIKATGLQAQAMQAQIMMQMQQMSAQMQQSGQPQMPQEAGGAGGIDAGTMMAEEEEFSPEEGSEGSSEFLEVPVEEQGITTREEATSSV